MVNDQVIIEYYKDKHIHSWKNIPEDHKKYLLNRFPDSQSLKEIVWRLLYHIYKRPTCLICGNPVQFHGRKNNIFSKTCSKECYSKIKSLHRHILSETDKKIIMQKVKNTKLERYGDENYNNREKFKETNLLKYGVQHFNKTIEGKNRIKQSMINKYGVEYAAQLNTNNFKTNNPQKNPIIKEKTRLTNIEKYGGPSPTCDKDIYLKQRKTQKENSGEYFWIKTKEAQLYFSKLMLNPEIQNKIRETCLKKYNVDWFSKSSQFKQIIKENKDTIQKKIYQTKKQNNSFNTSKFEEAANIILSSVFPNIKRSYNTLIEENSERYPFNCDFYIPEEDIFIEIQGSHYHHFKPFDENNLDDVKELNRLKSLAYPKSQYLSIIETWTIRDPKKRKIAKENHLNFLEFWSIEELINWLNNSYK